MSYSFSVWYCFSVALSRSLFFLIFVITRINCSFWDILNLDSRILKLSIILGLDTLFDDSDYKSLCVGKKQCKSYFASTDEVLNRTGTTDLDLPPFPSASSYYLILLSFSSASCLWAMIFARWSFSALAKRALLSAGVSSLGCLTTYKKGRLLDMWD